MKRPARRRARDPKVERLSQVQLFSACSKRDLSRIAALAEEVEVPTGRVLMRQGKRSTKLGPGECFGEMALLHSAPRSATVTAESDMRLFVLGSREFSALIERVPVVGQQVMAALAERLRKAERAQPHH